MDLAVDRLNAALQVVLVEDATLGPRRRASATRTARLSRADLVPPRRGRALDRRRALAVRPGTVTLIGRGQVHVFERPGTHRRGVRFGDEISTADDGRSAPEWLLAGKGGRTVQVPASDADHLDGVIAALAAEAARPRDARSAAAERDLLSVILLWIERWYDASRTERRAADDDEIQLYRRFAHVLERDYVRHHDAGHYADALAVPPAALSRALSQVTGRSTKDHITERVMLEAQRLLRFTELTVGEVAFRVGYEDQLYFSRAFKRHHGQAPTAYRSAT